jgi:hypothetical protein
MYAGTKEKTQGERKEASPARKGKAHGDLGDIHLFQLT